MAQLPTSPAARSLCSLCSIPLGGSPGQGAQDKGGVCTSSVPSRPRSPAGPLFLNSLRNAAFGKALLVILPLTSKATLRCVL